MDVYFLKGGRWNIKFIDNVSHCVIDRDNNILWKIIKTGVRVTRKLSKKYKRKKE